MGKGIQDFSSGYAGWRWLSGISSRERQWFLGSLRGRDGYLAWTTLLSKGLQNPEFLLRFEAEVDPWNRSKLVGQKISEIRQDFKKLSKEQRAELAKQGETELRTGLQLLGKDKKTIEELISLADPPAPVQ